MNRPLALPVALLLCSVFALAGPRAPAAQNAAKYAGSETCKTCHEAQWQAFQTNPHARAEADGKLVADHVGCEACHGPGSLHADAGGDKSDPGWATIRSFKNLAPDQANAVCLTCHKGGEQFYWGQGKHERKGVTCQSCHSVHHPKAEGGVALLRTASANELCLQCHRDKRAAMSKTAHMPVREGGITCVDCHNPHGSAGPHQIRGATNNELCLTCHADKRGPFLWEHAPVRENCLNCHEPHGTNNPKVLASKVPFLCQRCHNMTRHPGTLYDRPDLTSNRLFNRSCTNCHSQVHGSNHPSGKAFLR
jgi:DmsE family decaheme c-type cytochrome